MLSKGNMSAMTSHDQQFVGATLNTDPRNENAPAGSLCPTEECF